jgi:hypothetical protein
LIDFGERREYQVSTALPMPRQMEEMQRISDTRMASNLTRPRSSLILPIGRLKTRRLQRAESFSPARKEVAPTRSECTNLDIHYQIISKS